MKLNGKFEPDLNGLELENYYISKLIILSRWITGTNYR